MQRTIQKCKTIAVTLLFLAIGVGAPLSFAQAVSAATPNPCSKLAAGCQVVAESSGDCSNINQCDLINNYVNPLVNFLAALVGVGVVTSIVIGGIQYSSSAGDPSKASAAKNRIRNAIIALVAFLLLYGMLNFLIPGGLV